MKLIAAIAAYERQREAVEGWAAFVRAIERVSPLFYTALVKRWPLTPRTGKRGCCAA